MGSNMRWISSNELKDIIKGSSKDSPKEYAVVDVRDSDFVGGNIVDCLHIPSTKFEDEVGDLVEKLKDTPTVVFHCFLSQQRGPKAARIFRDARDEKFGYELAEKQEILILRGGFVDFQSSFKDDPELVENWRKEVWDLRYLESVVVPKPNS